MLITSCLNSLKISLLCYFLRGLPLLRGLPTFFPVVFSLEVFRGLPLFLPPVPLILISIYSPFNFLVSILYIFNYEFSKPYFRSSFFKIIPVSIIAISATIFFNVSKSFASITFSLGICVFFETLFI